MDPVEERVEALYREVELTTEQADALRAELLSQLEVQAMASGKERKQLERQIAKFDRQRYQWAEKVMAGSVPDDIGREKQAALARHLQTLRQTLAGLQAEAIDIEETLRQALDLAVNCYEGNRQSPADVRRQWNQAFFERIEVDQREGGSTAELTSLFGSLTALAQQKQPRMTPRTRCRTRKDPDLIFPSPDRSVGALTW